MSMNLIYFSPFVSQSVSGSGSATVYSYYGELPTAVNNITTTTSPLIQNNSIPYANYESCYIVLTGSLYPESSSGDRINLYLPNSGSVDILLASYPSENTTIIYELEGLTDTTQSFVDPIPESLSFGLNWTLTTSAILTSSLNSLAIYSGSTPATYSVYQATSSGYGYTSLDMATTYSVHVSGGGTYYTTSLKLEDAYYGNTLLYLTGSNSNISYNLSESYSGRFATYTLTANAESFNGILLEYGLSPIPIANSGSISEWNSLLGILANRVELSGSTVYLLGGTLTNTGSLIISSSVSSSIVNDGLINISTFGVTDLSIVNITSEPAVGSLTSFPSFPGTSISSLTVKNQNILGSAPDPLTYGNPFLIDCSYNQLSGNLPTFTTSSWVLFSYDCSNNALTGNFPDISVLNNLNTFICNNNSISGGLSTLPLGLSYFNCSNNYLTGSIPILSSSFVLQYFNASNNQLSSDIPTLNTSIQTFDVGYNNLTGDVPVLGDNTNLTTFIAKNNNIFRFPNPDLYTEPVVPSSLTYFDLENNILSNVGLGSLAKAFWNVFSGSAISGTINVSGSGNASATGSVQTIQYFNDLTASGWAIYANDYP